MVLQVIRGLDVAVAAMHMGDKVKISVPAALAYGSRGAGGDAVPPNSELIFDVELLGVLPGESQDRVAVLEHDAELMVEHAVEEIDTATGHHATLFGVVMIGAGGTLCIMAWRTRKHASRHII